MDNKEHLYSGLGVASLYNGGYNCTPFAMLSSSEEEAIGKIIQEMEARCPRSEGWFNHQASVFKVSTKLIRDCSQITDVIDESIKENRS